MTEREIRAKAIAARFNGAASAKGDVVRFGAPKNHGKGSVSIPALLFDSMADEDVAARIRAAWQSR